ncbi:MAG: hypothetical protein H6905_01845 [Hyphomicrobiales bacterium]|nr:hypothetical protein [Hyphomicrobiales bacterium]
MSDTPIKHRKTVLVPGKERAKNGGRTYTRATKAEPKTRGEAKRASIVAADRAERGEGEKPVTKSTGRPKGSRNVRTITREKAKTTGSPDAMREAILAICDPVLMLARVAAGEAIFDAADDETGELRKVPGSQKTRLDAMKTLANKVMPDLKSIEKKQEVGDNLASILRAAEERTIRMGSRPGTVSQEVPKIVDASYEVCDAEGEPVKGSK